jgi:hypothetical protein
MPNSASTRAVSLSASRSPAIANSMILSATNSVTSGPAPAGSASSEYARAGKRWHAKASRLIHFGTMLGSPPGVPGGGITGVTPPPTGGAEMPGSIPAGGQITPFERDNSSLKLALPVVSPGRGRTKAPVLAWQPRFGTGESNGGAGWSCVRGQRTPSFETCRISRGACRGLRRAKLGGRGRVGAGDPPASCPGVRVRSAWFPGGSPARMGAARLRAETMNYQTIS